MLSTSGNGVDESVVCEFESDLPALSCRAAGELDNLLTGRGIQKDAVRRLAVLISSALPIVEESSLPRSLFDPTTVVVMRQAIDDSAMTNKQLSTLNELVDQAGRIGDRLKGVAEDAEALKKRGPEEIKSLRSFCLALSKRASAQLPSIDEWEFPHPYRR